MTHPQPSTPDRAERASIRHPDTGNGQTAGCAGCPERWPLDAKSAAHCPTCHRSFASVGGFDAHRTGPIDNRRCLDETELRSLGYAPNARGRWRIPQAPEATARFADRTAA